MILSNIFDIKNPINMNPIEKPQFSHLCETMSNMHTYCEALGSLNLACNNLAQVTERIVSRFSKCGIRHCPDDLLFAIAKTEINIELIKQRYIHDMIDEHQAAQEQILTEVYKRYDIKEG